MQAYDTENRVNASTMSMKLMKKPRVLAEIERLSQSVGLTEEMVTQRLREGLNAKLITSYRGRAVETDLPDHTARHRYAQTAAKIMKMFPGKKTESIHTNIDVELEKMPPEQFAQLLTGMAKQINVRSKTKIRISKQRTQESPK